MQLKRFIQWARHFMKSPSSSAPLRRHLYRIVNIKNFVLVAFSQDSHLKSIMSVKIFKSAQSDSLHDLLRHAPLVIDTRATHTLLTRIEMVIPPKTMSINE